VFSEYRRLFPAVQLQVLRSYGSRVVEAVMENSADFGLTQLPVEEKRLQVVNVHRDEIKMIAPVDHPMADRKAVLASEIVDNFLILPKYGKNAHTPERMAGTGGRRCANLNGAGFQ